MATTVDLSAFVAGVTVTALLPGTLPGGRQVTHPISRRLAVPPYGFNGTTVVLNDGRQVDSVLADSIALAPDTLTFVHGDTAVTYAEPAVGMRVLVNNAGGFHQNPGSYGYTETVVREVETRNEDRRFPSMRIRTDAYGWGCWSTDKIIKVRA